MAESHVVSGLLSKREEIAGQITTIQAEIGRLQGALTHLDNTIKLFSPQYDLRTIKGKRTYTKSKNFERGEAQRMTLNVLRELKKPLCSREIVDELLERKNIESTTANIVNLQKNILTILHSLKKRNIVIQVDNVGGSLKWKIA
ncbi:hypothetical protein [Cellvibrio sp. OA-2007]|uniref:hypothetical protein n=1 Tax=Cellvibrio sp. OA-2007 TaxID=529823 RepID=UPI000781CF3B|nr:hypothetical protein [Cellvibrio sp. OA-2007]